MGAILEEKKKPARSEVLPRERQGRVFVGGSRKEHPGFGPAVEGTRLKGKPPVGVEEVPAGAVD